MAGWQESGGAHDVRCAFPPCKICLQIRCAPAVRADYDHGMASFLDILQRRRKEQRAVAGEGTMHEARIAVFSVQLPVITPVLSPWHRTRRSHLPPRSNGVCCSEAAPDTRTGIASAVWQPRTAHAIQYTYERGCQRERKVRSRVVSLGRRVQR